MGKDAGPINARYRYRYYYQGIVYPLLANIIASTYCMSNKILYLNKIQDDLSYTHMGRLTQANVVNCAMCAFLKLPTLLSPDIF